MSIDYLERSPELPMDRRILGEQEEFGKYIGALVNDLQRDKLADIHRTINYILDFQNDTIAYLDSKGTDDEYANGTWRINGDSSTQLLIQQKIAGVWTTIDTINPITGISLSGVAVYDDTVVCHNGEVVQV